MPHWLAIVLFVLCGISACFAFLEYDEGEYTGMVAYGIIALALGVAMGFIMNGSHRVDRVYATIDDNMPFVEVMEEYTIHDRQGDIWVLEKPKDAK
jgi:hypothetical protein